MHLLHVASIFCFNPRTTQGATRQGRAPRYRQRVSIHAPTRGATCIGLLWLRCCRCFNPRTHTGCDFSRFDDIEPISTFQSTHPHGVRLSASCRPLRLFPFQSTHPHGVRREHLDRVRRTFGFQSTHPHGVRHDFKDGYLSNRVSIHAPTRGATRRKIAIQQTIRFQSTHPHGVRLCESAIRTIVRCFNPRTHTGCDIHNLVRFRISRRFNPRTHTGCDTKRVEPSAQVTCFNPRTHTGCDTIR